MGRSVSLRTGFEVPDDQAWFSVLQSFPDAYGYRYRTLLHHAGLNTNMSPSMIVLDISLNCKSIPIKYFPLQILLLSWCLFTALKSYLRYLETKLFLLRHRESSWDLKEEQKHVHFGEYEIFQELEWSLLSFTETLT